MLWCEQQFTRTSSYWGRGTSAPFLLGCQNFRGHCVSPSRLKALGISGSVRLKHHNEWQLLTGWLCLFSAGDIQHNLSWDFVCSTHPAWGVRQAVPFFPSCFQNCVFILEEIIWRSSLVASSRLAHEGADRSSMAGKKPISLCAGS